MRDGMEYGREPPPEVLHLGRKAPPLTLPGVRDTETFSDVYSSVASRSGGRGSTQRRRSLTRRGGMTTMHDLVKCGMYAFGSWPLMWAALLLAHGVMLRLALKVVYDMEMGVYRAAVA